MSQLSPLGRLLVSVLHKGSWAAGALVLLFAGILLMQRWTAEGLQFQQGDIGFLGILAVCLAVAAYLVRGFKREMD